MIVKEGQKWVLYTRDGKRVLGKHASKASAQKQELAIRLAKARKK
jgi:hypothetical protein